MIWMRRQLFIILLFFLHGTVMEASLPSFEEIKEQIIVLQNRLKKPAPEAEKSRMHFQLATAFYLDQEIDKAFEHFLNALDHVEPQPAPELAENEQKIFDEALNLYLSASGIEPIQMAEMLLDKYGVAANENRDFLHLNFLISTAYANLGVYDTFFERFYTAYPYLKDSYLAYKTQAILYLRLAQHGVAAELRQQNQKKAFHCLTAALERNPKDSGLYKILILLAKDENNDAFVLSYLQKMVEQKVLIPRADIYLYVKEAVALGKYALGQEIIDHARSIYNFSRALSAAQDYLNQYKG